MKRERSFFISDSTPNPAPVLDTVTVVVPVLDPTPVLDSAVVVDPVSAPVLDPVLDPAPVLDLGSAPAIGATSELVEMDLTSLLQTRILGDDRAVVTYP